MIKNGVALKDSLSKTKVVRETIAVENKSKKVETNFVENVLKASFVSFTWKEVQQFKIRQVCCVFRPAKKYTTKYVVYFDVCWSKYRYHANPIFWDYYISIFSCMLTLYSGVEYY